MISLSFFLGYIGAPNKYPGVSPFSLKNFFTSLLLSASILSISELTGLSQMFQLTNLQKIFLI